MDTKVTTTGTPVSTTGVTPEPEAKAPETKKEPASKVFTFAALDLVNKMLAPLASLGIKVPVVESLDANGYIKEPEAKKTAVAETDQKLTAHLAKPETKKLDPKSNEHKQKVAEFLQKETQFPLLPPQEQAAFLKAHGLSDVTPQLKQNWTVNQRFAYAFQLEAGKRLGSDTKAAGQLYEMALRWDPENGQLHYQAAWALNFGATEEKDPAVAKKSYEAALRHLQAATAKDPQDFMAWRMAAQTLVKAGRPDDAVGVFSTALRVGKETGASPEDLKSLEGDKKGAEEKAQVIYGKEAGARPAEISEILVLVTKHLPSLSIEEQKNYLTGKDVTQATLVPETPAAAQLAALMKQQGVKPGEVVPFKDPKDVKSQDYLNYAFENYPKFQKEIEACFGKMPFNKEEQPDPKFVTSLFDGKSVELKNILTRHQQLKAKVEGLKLDLLEKSAGMDGYESALQEAEKSQPEFKLLEMYDRLLTSSKGSLQQKAGLYLAIQGEEAKAKAKEGRLTLFNPADAKPVVAGYAAAGNCYDKAFALGGDPRDAKTAAENYYTAAAFAPKGEAKGLYLQGVASLQKIQQLPSSTSAGALEKDPEALKLMAVGLQSAGMYREALQALDLAYVAGDKSPALMNEVEANKKHLATYEKLGAPFHAKLQDLEAKEKAGKLNAEEAGELKLMRTGLDLIERCNHSSFPLTQAPAEPAFVAKVRDQVVESLKLPLSADKVKAAEDSVKRLEKAEGALKKMEAERGKLAQQVFKDAPYVIAYLEKTKDYSWLRLDYSGLKPGDEWNPDILNKLPALEAFQTLKQKDPAAAKQIEDALAIFQQPKLLADLDKIGSLEALETQVELAEAKIFKTDASGKVLQETNPLTGEKVKRYEANPAFALWAVESEKLELEKNPISFIRNGVGKNQQGLQALAKAMPELEKVAQDLKDTEGKLAAAQKSGDAAEVKKQEAKLADIKKNLGALKTFLASQADDFLKDYATYQKHAEKLGVVEKDGAVPFGKEMAAAKINIEKLKKDLEGIDADKEPAKSLATMQTDFKALAGSQKVFLKSLTFADAAMAKGWRSTSSDVALPGPTTSNLLDTGGTPAVDSTYALKNELAALSWDMEKEKLNKAFGDHEFSDVEIQADRDQHGGFAFLADAAGIGARLKATQTYLQKNDEAMFKSLQSTLTEGIEFEIEKWSAARAQMAERGDSTKEIDKLIAKYFDAKFALRDGDTGKALALYREAADSKRSNVVFQQYEASNKNQAMRTMVLEITIITAATLLTAGTMSAAAGASVTVVEAGAAMEIGAATVGQQVLMLGLESVAFVGWDKAIHYGLHKGTGAVEDPFKNARDAKGSMKYDLLALDLTFDVVKNMGLFKTLRTAGEFYQAVAIGRKVLANPATRGLIEEAAKISSTHGKILFKQLMEIEMSNLGMIGKAAFKAGSFGTEAAAMQGWNNIATLLEVPYQNAVHGKKLEFATELKNVNSAESIEHGLLQLVGLKIGGFGTHPLQASMASGKTQQAALGLKIKHFGELREGLSKNFSAPDAAFNPKTKQQINEFIKLGDYLYGTGEKSGKLSPEQLQEWKEVRTSLDAIVKVEAQMKQLVSTAKAASDQLHADMKQVVDSTKGVSTPEQTAGLEKGFKAGQVVVASVGKTGSAEFHLVSKEPVAGDPAFEKVTVGGTTYYRKATDKAAYEAYQAYKARTTPPPLPQAAKAPNMGKPEAEKLEGKTLESPPAFDAAALAGVKKVAVGSPAEPGKKAAPPDLETRKQVFLDTIALAKQLGFETLNPFLGASFKKFAERLATDPHPEKTLGDLTEMATTMQKNLQGVEPVAAKGIKETLLGRMLRGEVKGKGAVWEACNQLRVQAGLPAAGKMPAAAPKSGEVSGVVAKGHFLPGGEFTGTQTSGDAPGGGAGAKDAPALQVTPEALHAKGDIPSWTAGEGHAKEIYQKAAAAWVEGLAPHGEAGALVDRWAELAKLAAGGDPQAKEALKALADIHEGAANLRIINEGGAMSPEVGQIVAAKLETALARFEFYKKNLAADGGEVPRLKTAQLIRANKLSEVEKAREVVDRIEAKKAAQEPVTPEEEQLYQTQKTVFDAYKAEFAAAKKDVSQYEEMALEKKAAGKEGEIPAEQRQKYEASKAWLKKYEVLNKIWTVTFVGKDPAAVQAAKDARAAIGQLQELNVSIQKLEGEIPSLTGEKKVAAEKQLKQLQGLRHRNLQLVEKWEQVDGEYTGYVTAFSKLAGPFEQDEVRINSKGTNLKLIRGDIQQKYHGDVKAYYKAFAARNGTAKDYFSLYGTNVEKFVEAEILPPRECPVDFLNVETTPLHEYQDYQVNFMKGVYGEADRLPLQMRFQVKAGDKAAMLDYLTKKYSDPANNAQIISQEGGVLVLEMLKPAGQKVKITVAVPGESAAPSVAAKTVPPPKMKAEGKVKPVESGPDSAPPTVKPGKPPVSQPQASGTSALKLGKPKGETPPSALSVEKTPSASGEAILPPPPSSSLAEPVFPKPTKVPVDLERKMAVTNDLFDKIYPTPEGRPRYLEANVIEEVKSIQERLMEIGHEEVALLLRSDFEMAMKAPYESEVYQGAIDRLSKAIALRRSHPEYAKAPVEFMGEASLKKFGGHLEKIYNGEKVEIETASDAKVDAGSKPAAAKQPVSDLEAMKLLKAKGITKEFGKHLNAIRKMTTVEEVHAYLAKVNAGQPAPAATGYDAAALPEGKVKVMPPTGSEALPVLGKLGQKPVGLEVSNDSPWVVLDHQGKKVLLQNEKTGEKQTFEASSEISVAEVIKKGARVEIAPLVAGGGGTGVSSKAPKAGNLVVDETGFAVRLADGKGPEKVDVDGRPLIFRRAQDGEFEVAAYGEIDVVAKDGTAKKIPASKFGQELKWVKLEAGDKVGAKQQVFKGAAVEDAAQAEMGEESLPVLGKFGGKSVGGHLSKDSPWVVKDRKGSKLLLIHEKTGEKQVFEAASEKQITPDLKPGARLEFAPLVAGASDSKIKKHPKVRIGIADMDKGPLPALSPQVEDGTPYFIGSNAANPMMNYVIDNHLISGTHAVITSQKDAKGVVHWALQDGGFNPETGTYSPSKLGVWVDGQKVNGKVEIRPGQKIRIGFFDLEFAPQTAKEYDSAALVGVPSSKVPSLPDLPAVTVLKDNAKGKPRRGVLGSDKPTAVYWSYSAATHEGVGYKPYNEDGMVQGSNWAVVLDGMGGMGHGDKASQIAGEAIAQYMYKHAKDGNPAEVFRRAFVAGGEAVNNSPYRDGGAVAVGHWIVKNPDGSYKAILAHVGDARAVVVGKDGKIKHVSKDQSLVQINIGDKAGPGVDPQEIELKMRTDPTANVVLGGLGTGMTANPVITEIPLEPGDRIIMVSDGVSDNMSSADMAKAVAGSATAKQAQAGIFGTALTKMTDLEDAVSELKDGKRLPITSPEGETRWIDSGFNLWDSQQGGKIVDHYKPDNLTVHVYFHDIPGATAGSGPESVKKKVINEPADGEAKPELRDAASGKPLALKTGPAGAYQLAPGIVLRADAQGGWEILDGRDPVAREKLLQQVAKGHTMALNWNLISPVKINGKEIKMGEPAKIAPGDHVEFLPHQWQFSLPGPKPFDVELAGLSSLSKSALQARFMAADSFVEIKQVVTDSGLPAREKVLADLQACIEGKTPVDALPQALREAVLRSMKSQAEVTAKFLPKGFSPKLDMATYQGGLHPEEIAFHGNRAEVLLRQQLEFTDSFSEVREAVAKSPLAEPYGIHRGTLLEALEKLGKGEIQALDHLPKGPFLERMRAIWEAKNHRMLEEAEPPSLTGVNPDAVQALKTLDQEAARLYAQLGKMGAVAGTAKTYSVAELREVIYEVLERGKPLSQVTSQQGIRKLVEAYMKFAIDQAKRALKSNPDNLEKNFFTGEKLMEKNYQHSGQGSDYVPSLEARYRFARMLLNQKGGRPLYGEPSMREKEILAGFGKILGAPGIPQYSQFQTLIRDHMERLSPEFQAAFKGANQATRDLVIQTYFGLSRHRTMSSPEQALGIAAFLGKAGYYREVGVTLDPARSPMQVNLTLGDIGHVSPEERGLFFLLHTHPNHEEVGGFEKLSRKGTMVFGEKIGKQVESEYGLELPSNTDIKLYIRDAKEMFGISKYDKTDVSILYDKEKRVYRNWVQHSGGLSKVEVVLNEKGELASLKVTHGVYQKNPKASAGMMIVGGKLIPKSQKSFFAAEMEHDLGKKYGVPVSVEEVSPESLEAGMPKLP